MSRMKLKNLLNARQGINFLNLKIGKAIDYFHFKISQTIDYLPFATFRGFIVDKFYFNVGQTINKLNAKILESIDKLHSSVKWYAFTTAVGRNGLIGCKGYCK